MNKTITFSTSLSHICYATWMKSESLLCLANLLLFLDFLWQLMEPSPCKASKPKSKSVLYLWRTSSALDKTEQLAQTVIKQNNMWSNHFQSLDHRQHKTNLWEKESSQGEPHSRPLSADNFFTLAQWAGVEAVLKCIGIPAQSEWRKWVNLSFSWNTS